MRAVVLESYGETDVLAVTEVADPVAGPEEVLQYVAGYTHRVAIGNARILALADGTVTFRWRDSRVGGRAS